MQTHFPTVWIGDAKIPSRIRIELEHKQICGEDSLYLGTGREMTSVTVNSQGDE